MSKLVSMLNSLKEKTKSSVLRFPATILCLIIIYVLTDIRRYTNIQPNDRLFLTLSYGVLATFIVEMLLENLKQTNIRFRLICYFVTYIILQVSYFFVGTKIAPNLCIFTALTSLAIVVLYNKERGQFETNLAKILVNEFVAGCLTFVLTSGVLLILWSMDVLLIDISSDAFIECLQMACLIVFPILFLSGIPKIGEDLEYPTIIKKIIRFIILPILTVFTVILYAYYGKLVFTKTFPIAGLMLISISFLRIAVPILILMKPFDEKVPKYARKWGVFLLIPVVLVLIFTAIYNINNIGITYVGYFSIVLSIITIIEIILIKLKNGKYQYTIFLVAALFSLICGFGPISVNRTITISQQNILTTTLQKNDMLKAGKIIPKNAVSKEDKKKIIDAYQYLKRYSLELPSYCNPKYNEYMSAEEIFGFKNEASYEDLKRETFVCENEIIDVSGYKYVTNERLNLISTKTDKGELRVKADFKDGEKWLIYLNDELLFEKDRNEIRNTVYDKISKLNKDKYTQDEMSYVYNSDKINLKVVYNYLEYVDGKYDQGKYTLLLNLPDKEILE